jgi:hypothetical protein
MIGSLSLEWVRNRLQRIGSYACRVCVLSTRLSVCKRGLLMSLSPQNIWERFRRKPLPPVCRICGKPVAVEISKTDEDGRAIHEDCYVLKIQLEQASKDEYQAYLRHRLIRQGCIGVRNQSGGWRFVPTKCDARCAAFTLAVLGGLTLTQESLRTDQSRCRLTAPCFLLDDCDAWTLNASLTTSSSYRKCSKRRT